MKQYHQLLKDIKEKGTYKAPARENMPGTLSLFGYQNRYNLQDGFPILTTKKVNFKHIVTELLWFLRGDTNVKYLIDNGCNIWNEDAYNYYVKLGGKHYSFEKFVEAINFNSLNGLYERGHDEMFKVDYTLGDCGKQYGWLWRSWETQEKYWDEEPTTILEKDVFLPDGSEFKKGFKYRASHYKIVDQIEELINGLKSNPTGRRHIITAWNPATLNDMALNACHAFVQFNCRPLNKNNGWERYDMLLNRNGAWHQTEQELKERYGDTDFGQWIGFKKFKVADANQICDLENIPKYYLDCQMYQRSADVFLGVPYNIASYALLTHILAKICNMEVGDLIHTFGDVHIYDNHLEAVDEILTRTPTELPTLNMNVNTRYQMGYELGEINFTKFINSFKPIDFTLENYNPQASIKAKLSTGLIK